MAIIKNFKSTSIWKAFVLSSITSSLIIIISISVNQKLNSYRLNHKNINKDNNKLNWFSIYITFITTFFVSLVCFTMMYFLFGFGGGMISPT